MRTVIVRVVQLALVALLAISGYRLVNDSVDAQTYHKAAMVSLDVHEETVLGPTGIGKLTLGMSAAEATATGEAGVEPNWSKHTTSTCFVTSSGKNSLHFARDHGLAVITAAPKVKTPEGIGAGATVAEVAAAYPTLNHPEAGTPEQQAQSTGYLAAKAPGNPKANYVFLFTVAGHAKPDKVQLVMLALADQEKQCNDAA